MEFVVLDTGRIGSADEMDAAIKVAADKMLTLNYKHCVKEVKYIGNRAAGLSLHGRDEKRARCPRQTIWRAGDPPGRSRLSADPRTVFQNLP